MPRPHSPEHVAAAARRPAIGRAATGCTDCGRAAPRRQGDPFHLGSADETDPARCACCPEAWRGTSSSNWCPSRTSGHGPENRRRAGGVRRADSAGPRRGFPGVCARPTTGPGWSSSTTCPPSSAGCTSSPARPAPPWCAATGSTPCGRATPGSPRRSAACTTAPRGRRVVGRGARQRGLSRGPARRHQRRPARRGPGPGARGVAAHGRPARRHLPLARGAPTPSRTPPTGPPSADHELRLVRVPPDRAARLRPGAACPSGRAWRCRAPTPSPRSRAPGRSRCASPTCSRASPSSRRRPARPRRRPAWPPCSPS